MIRLWSWIFLFIVAFHSIYGQEGIPNGNVAETSSETDADVSVEPIDVMNPDPKVRLGLDETPPTPQTTSSSPSSTTTESSSTSQSTSSSPSSTTTESSSTPQSTSSSPSSTTTESSSTPQSTTPETDVSTDAPPEIVTTPEPEATTKSPIENDFDKVVKDEDGIPCIGAKMNITLDVTYETKDNKTANVIINVPNNAQEFGDCIESYLGLRWTEPSLAVDDLNNTVEFHFKNNEISYYIESIKVHVYLNPAKFPNAQEETVTSERSGLSLYATSMGHIQQCSSEKTEQLEKMNVILKDVSLFAYNNDASVGTKTVDKCYAEGVAEEANVGAIVGGVIGGLAVIAIIGFFIWRHKKRAHNGSDAP